MTPGLTLISYRVGSFLDSQAVTHFNRVIAAGGTVPAGLVGCDAWFKAVKGAYGVSDITTAISSGIDPHYLGYKLGAGSGATLGSAAQTCYNAIGAIGDVIQTTAASQPLILPHTGTNYTWLPGVDSNNFTTPNASANQITGDIDIKFHINYANNGGTQFLVSKTQTVLSNHGYDLAIQSSNTLYYQQSRAGVFNSCQSSVGIGANYTGWVRMTRVSSTGVVTFFTSPDGTTWTQLGTTFTLFSGALNNPTTNVNIGSYFNTNSVFRGIIYRATIANSIGGTPVVDFNPANYNRSVSQTTWTSSTGEVWTMNYSSSITGYKSAIIDRTILMGDGIDDKMVSSTLNFTAPTYLEVVANVFATNPGTTAICSGNNLIYYTQDGGVRVSVKDGNLQGNASGYNARLLTLEGLQISRVSNQFIFSKNNVNTLVTSVGGSPVTDSSVVALFANLAGNLPSNCIINTLIFSNYPTSPQRTNMYNVLRSFNNNAF